MSSALSRPALQPFNGMRRVTVARTEGGSGDETVTFACRFGIYRHLVTAVSGSGGVHAGLQAVPAPGGEPGRGHRRPTSMRRHRALTLLALAVTVMVGLSACGDDSSTVTSPSEPGDGTGDSGGDTGGGGGGGIEHPTGANEAVLEIREEGGLAGPQQVAGPAALVVTGDGRLVQPGPVIEIYPGPLLPNLQQRTISEDGLQHLLALADEHGLLADATYPALDNVMDAPDTVVTINAGGQSYEHRANALGFEGEGGETDESRARLQDFVTAATELATSTDPSLGDEEPYVADVYLIRALPDQPDRSPDGLEASIVEWPSEAPVRLADAADCAEVPAASVADVLASANQLTRFVDAGVSYALSVQPRVAGQSCRE
jgi:hypothetical protein